MTKEFGTLTHHWNGSLEQVQDWLCSRKYNGWSTIWDGGITRGKLATEIPWYYKGGDKKQIISTGLWTLGRNNKPKVLQAPKYYIEKLPNGVPVHGELWYKDRLDIIKRTCGTKKFYNPMWYNITFMAFNIKPYKLWNGLDKLLTLTKTPCDVFDNFTFADVIDYLPQFENDIFKVIKTVPIRNKDDIRDMQMTSIENQWEGLIFANPKGQYECKRSWNNLKWKGIYEVEGAIYGYEDGKTGKNIGKVGALKATLIWNCQVISVFGGSSSFVNKEVDFCIGGLTDKEREWDYCKEKYPVGSKIKFKYNGVSVHGIPQSCNIYRGM